MKKFLFIIIKVFKNVSINTISVKIYVSVYEMTRYYSFRFKHKNITFIIEVNCY